MRKTALRKDIDGELKDKLLLKNASVFQIFSHLIKRYSTELFWVGLFVVGVSVGVVL